MPGQSHAGAKHAKSGLAAQTAFRRVVPDDERVTVRPMFGSVAAFAGGQMFMCLFDNELYYRLGGPDREALRTHGGTPLEPMPGRPMREYMSLPEWQLADAPAHEWGDKALGYAISLGPKKK
jgi:TfoX/Sxy family transcriptional regulator of competence genes